MDNYIQFRIDTKTKEDLKKAIKEKEPYLINTRSDGISAVLTKFIHEYISKEDVSK